VYFSDKSRNEYGLMTIWEKKEDFEAFSKSNPVPQSARALFAGTLLEQRGFYVNNSF
jgi:heme-degrading monooxygenase HmoA